MAVSGTRTLRIWCSVQALAQPGGCSLTFTGEVWSCGLKGGSCWWLLEWTLIPEGYLGGALISTLAVECLCRHGVPCVRLHRVPSLAVNLIL